MSSDYARTFSVHSVREVNDDPILGIKFFSSRSAAVDDTAIARLIEFLGGIASKLEPTEKPADVQTLQSVAGSHISWTRIRSLMYPVYIERLTVLPVAEFGEHTQPPIRPAAVAGEFVVSDNCFVQGKDHYSQNESAWAEWLTRTAAAGTSGGLSLNFIEIPKSALESGEIDVRPLVLHALATDGLAPDRFDSAAQAAIANAFWQTFWATGARRTERGATFPVAFLPIDRTHTREYDAPFNEWWVSLRRRLFGRTSILAFACEILTKVGALFFDPQTNRFGIRSDISVNAIDLPDDKAALALFELNRTGFVDAYTGQNKELLPSWPTALDSLPREPWPLADTVPALESFRLSTDQQKNAIRIHRIVPYGGCAFLYQAVSEIDKLRATGRVQDFEDEILAATNSTFFLNFPEEYATLHSAMNDAVSLLVENGRTHQLRTMRRATFVLSESGDANITTAAANKLNNPALIYEGESTAVTSFDRAHLPYSQNQYGPIFFGCVLVGNSIVETFEEITTEIPGNGWIVGDSEAFGGEIDPRNAVEAQVRTRDGHADVPIRHAFAVGPLLVQEGKPVKLGDSREQFQSIELRETPAFEDSRDLSRTELAPAFLNCEKRGVAPTRFPYDWDRTRAPRSAIGIRDDGTVVLAVIDGRADLPHSIGATLAELAQIMINLKCTSALNMDGGGSSVMFVNDDAARAAKLRQHLRDGVVNLPSDLGGVERLLPVPLVITRRKRK